MKNVTAWEEVTCCRICGAAKGTGFERVLDLGSMPLPNGFLSDPSVEEAHYPLTAAVCTACWLMQLEDVVPADKMFSNYVYVPSTSQTMREHFKALAVEQIAARTLTRKDRVLDIGSNDGTLLRSFLDAGLEVQGVDPAVNLAAIANSGGIPTFPVAFSAAWAREVEQRFRLITCTNCLAHVNDLHDLMDGVTHLLRDDGAFVAEFPYLPDTLERNEFDTIYHEHLSYFALGPVMTLATRHGMGVTDVSRQPVHGGSLRVTMQKDAPHCDEAVGMREAEAPWRKIEAYASFALRSRANMRGLVAELKRLKRQGTRIACYGASAKGNVLLNACDIGTELVDCIYDSIPYKHGKWSPGMHVPVRPESEYRLDLPDVLLLTAWNFREEILAKVQAVPGCRPTILTAVPEVLRVEA